MTAGDLTAAFPSISRHADSRHLRVGREWRYSVGPQPCATQVSLSPPGALWEETLAKLERHAQG